MAGELLESDRPPHDHVVSFYDRVEDLTGSVADFVAQALIHGEAALVVATGAHRHDFDDALRRSGVDIDGALASGQYLPLDAGETLASFMRDGSPDPRRFAGVMGALLTDVTRAGLPVRCFGEMVALLWQEGNVSGAIELEELWNDLARQHHFSLFCAYPISAVARSLDLHAAHQLCRLHSGLVAPGSYLADVPSPVNGQGDPARSQLFLPVATAVRASRQFLREALDEWDLAELYDDGAIIVSELAANALLHTGSPFRVVLHRSQSTVRVAVHDVSIEAPRLMVPAFDDVSGRGMALVAGLSSDWGTNVHAEGKDVWADLARVPR